MGTAAWTSLTRVNSGLAPAIGPDTRIASGMLETAIDWAASSGERTLIGEANSGAMAGMPRPSYRGVPGRAGTGPWQ